MNVSYRWLRDLAPDLSAPPRELSDHLAARGFPVEDLRSLAEGLEGLVVARVRTVRPHPNADRLRICEVDGGDGVVQVVCGAPVVNEGAFYPLAPVGSTLPGGMEIRQAKLRGEVSVGMLCSERELGLGRDHQGIMELEGTFTPGEPLVGALGLDDVRMEVEVTPNRPDLLSHLGVAREAAPGGDASLRLPEIPGEDPEAVRSVEEAPLVEDPREAEAGGVRIRIQDPELCPRYLGLVIRGVGVGPSPSWLQTRLRAAGARPINNVVDATNYVLLELGQPLHAFDLDRIEEGTIVVRTAGEGEEIRTLDGELRKLSGDMLAICDARRPAAVAGVMGGEDSEVTDATTDLLLECALFKPASVRSTRKALGLSTDASYRFERGVDPEGMERALRRVARIILATAGGRVEGPILDVRPEPFRRTTLSLRLARVEQILGVPFTGDRVRALLEPLGFGVGDESDGVLPVEVPGFRSWDVTREVDLVEEVARTHGFDNFPDTLNPFRPGSVPDHPLFHLEDRLREELTAWGLLEAQTPAFAPDGEGEVELLNPISTEERFLRRSLVPALLRRLERNLARGNRDVRLFELGTVFEARTAGELPLEHPHLAVVLHGRRAPEHWSADPGAVDLWDVKGLLEAVVRVVEPEGWELSPPAGGGASFVDPGQAFVVTDSGGTAVGDGGRILPAGLDLPAWAGELWGLEIRLPAEPEIRDRVSFRPLPTHPGVERDLALLIPEEQTVGEVLTLVRERGGPHLRESRVFDVYRGKGVDDGLRSVAVRLRFRADDRTLRDQEVDDVIRGLTRALEEELRVGLRGSQG
jgi:phenylalanyl-tRNA synthetase beta chain